MATLTIAVRSVPSLAALPGLDVSHLPAGFTATAAGAANAQTRASFAAEAETIAAGQTRLTWLAPSRDENADGSVLREEEAALWIGSADDQPSELDAAARANVLTRMFAVAHGGGALILATHAPEVADRCDGILELHRPD